MNSVALYVDVFFILRVGEMGVSDRCFWRFRELEKGIWKLFLGGCRKINSF